MSIQEELKSQAIELGLCKQWTEEWGNPNTDKLCDMFIRGIDFCIKHNWPSVDYLSVNFNPKDLEKNGIYYVGRKKSFHQQNVISMGDSVVDIYVPDGRICDIYTRHNSTINLHIGDGAFVYISILDDSNVNIVSKGFGAKIKCSYYSGTINNKEQFDTIHNKNQK